MTKEEWKRTIGEQGASGFSVSRFCRERGISDSGFGYWRKKLKDEGEPGAFVRVETCELMPVELPGGRTVRVRRGDLPALLEALCGR